LKNKKFNVRVYGLLINDNKEILVLDETRNGFHFTKFPGGGLEWGEGIKDCLKREFKEELGVQVQVNELYYLTENFIQSAFNSDDQLISIYFFVSILENENIGTLSENEVPRWISLSNIHEDCFTFPIDKLVVEKIKSSIKI
jgi:8-oxo-dGTP diphosphatase